MKLRYDEGDTAEPKMRLEDPPLLQLDGSAARAKVSHRRRGSQEARELREAAGKARAPSRLRNSFSSEMTVTQPEKEDTGSFEDLRDAVRRSRSGSPTAEPVFDDNHPNEKPSIQERRRGRVDSLDTEIPDNHLVTHESTIARARVDATLAVIPADAFKRLTKKYPKASAHIVQGKSCL